MWIARGFFSGHRGVTRYRGMGTGPAPPPACAHTTIPHDQCPITCHMSQPDRGATACAHCTCVDSGIRPPVMRDRSCCRGGFYLGRRRSLTDRRSVAAACRRLALLRGKPVAPSCGSSPRMVLRPSCSPSPPAMVAQPSCPSPPHPLSVQALRPECGEYGANPKKTLTTCGSAYNRARHTQPPSLERAHHERLR